MTLAALPSQFGTTRDTLQRVAAHVLARRRFERSGKFGLRATPGGFGTPAFGDDFETLRVAGTSLVREVTGAVSAASSLELIGATLADVAVFADVELADDFSVGSDTPPIGDPSEVLAIDVESVMALAEWFRFGWQILDVVVAASTSQAQPSAIQLWPEHFDAGFDLEVDPSTRVNVGASPGDGFSEEPYLYVGPWTDARPGDPSLWNAPFGAVLRYAEIRGQGDALEHASEFVARRIAAFGRA